MNRRRRFTWFHLSSAGGACLAYFKRIFVSFFPFLRQPFPWKFEGSLTRGLDKQPSDPVIERLRNDVEQVSIVKQLVTAGELASLSSLTICCRSFRAFPSATIYVANSGVANVKHRKVGQVRVPQKPDGTAAITAVLFLLPC